jgi:hypothetical protein
MKVISMAPKVAFAFFKHSLASLLLWRTTFIYLIRVLDEFEYTMMLSMYTAGI